MNVKNIILSKTPLVYDPESSVRDSLVSMVYPFNSLSELNDMSSKYFLYIYIKEMQTMDVLSLSSVLNLLDSL